MENSLSNEEVLSEITRLAKELAAYQMIVNGFRLLSDMPEKAGKMARFYTGQADDYRAMEASCVYSLQILHKIKAERGL